MSAKSLIVKLTAIVSLKRDEGKLKLCADIGVKGKNAGIDIRFRAQWKGPDIMSIIMNKHQVVFETRKARNWSCPDISVYNLKRNK